VNGLVLQQVVSQFGNGFESILMPSLQISRAKDYWNSFCATPNVTGVTQRSNGDSGGQRRCVARIIFGGTVAMQSESYP
jgi:hypothetical protein